MILWKIFWLFTRVAVFSWGGGPASLALMQREVVSAGWSTSAEFADAVAMGHALPGTIAPQVSAYFGYKLAGVPGAVAAVTGTVLPTTLLMMIMIVYFFHIKDKPAVKSMLTGVRPVVIGLLLWTAYAMTASVFNVATVGWGTALVRGWDQVLIVFAAFALLVLTRVNPVFLILGAAALGLLVYR